MYEHILVATDGSELSAAAIRHAVGLAKALQARVTALTVIRPWHTVAPGEIMVAFPESEYRKGAEAAAVKYLGVAADAAKAAGASCETRSMEHDQPWRAIISAAEADGCDLIVMASHGRTGLAALFLGSETQKVLTHGTIPVLVCR
ncbi:MAG: universal stress protein [Hyphomicrobiaceae bacterium]|nr:universal stress protein [Hyphomicrobiaceae bacterium]